MTALRAFRTNWLARPAIDWSGFLLATGLLAGTFALVGLALGSSLFLPNPASFFTDNATLTPIRRRLLEVMLLFGGMGVGIALIPALLARGDGARAVDRLARLASPLALIWAFAALAVERIWRGQPLTFLVLLAISVLLFERTLRASLTAVPDFAVHGLGELYERLPPLVRRALPFTLVLAGAVGYASYTGYWSVQQHHRLATSSFDLGIADNVIYNALVGLPFRASVLFGPDGGNFIAGHANFILLLFVPLYAIAPRAETLLILQSVLLGFAAIPLYGFAKTQIPRWSAALLSLAYLLYAPLHGLNFYDFHWLPACIFFLLCLFWAIATGRSVLIWLFWFLCVLIREDVPVGLTLVGVFLIATRYRVWTGVAMSVLSVAAFVVIKFVIMPAAGTWWFAGLYVSLVPPGEDGYGSVVRTILINPTYFTSTLLEKDKLLYALHLFAPIAFLPARRWVLLLCASSGFFFTLMTTKYAPTIAINFQYTSHWIPYLFAASALALAWMGRAPGGTLRRRAAVWALALGVTLHSLTFGALLRPESFVGGFSAVPFKITDEERARYRELRELIALIPREASVAATDAETPHISNRITAYALRESAGDADYLLIRKPGLNFLGSRASVQRAFERNVYGLVQKRADFYLFRRDHTSPDTEAAIAELGIKPEKTQ
jgi:uncharacterized membrane protein